MSDLKYTVAYASPMGTQYLYAVQTLCCGTEIEAYFSPSWSCAFPFSYDDAKKVRDYLQSRRVPVDERFLSQMRSLYQNDPSALTKFADRPSLQVVPVPWLPRKEVSQDEN